MEARNLKPSIAGIRTISIKLFANGLWVLMVATYFFFTFLGTAYCAENHTVENSNIVPVVNADLPLHGNAAPSKQVRNPDLESGPLSSASTSTSATHPPARKEYLSGSDTLTDMEKEVIRLHTEKIEEALTLALLEVSTHELSVKESSNRNISSASGAFKENFQTLASLAENSSHPEQVQKAILAAVSGIFDRIEKKSIALQNDTNETKNSLELFEELLKQDDTKINTILKSPKKDGASALSLKDISNPDLSGRTQRLDKALNDIMEILRRGSANEKTTALQRAVYRTWYLSIAQKTRTLRLNRLQMMLAEQRQIENFKTSSPQK